MQTHLIGIQDSPDHRLSVIRRLSLYEFTLWGRDLMSIVRIREIIEVYFKEKYENFVGTLETVRNREVIEGWGL